MNMRCYEVEPNVARTERSVESSSFDYETDGSLSSVSTGSQNNSRNDVILDDAASSMIVSDKKKWLKTAFKKSEGTVVREKKLGSSAANAKTKSDVVHCRDESREPQANTKLFEHSDDTCLSDRADTCIALTSIGDECHILEQNEVNNDADDDANKMVPFPVSAVEETKQEVGEDRTPLDFCAARDLIVQRSKKNGNRVYVKNKVYCKKEKFERMERENKRKSSPMGLLKASWEQADPTGGRPKTVYHKKFVNNIAPKRSVEELP